MSGARHSGAAHSQDENEQYSPGQHDRDHHDHAAHADLNSADGRQRVAIACAITAVFAVVEAVGGIVSGHGRCLPTPHTC